MLGWLVQQAWAVWPDWAIYWTLDKFLKPWAAIKFPNLPHSWAIFVKVSKSIIFLVKSFLGNFYRHLAIFFWSHWAWAWLATMQRQKQPWFNSFCDQWVVVVVVMVAEDEKKAACLFGLIPDFVHTQKSWRIRHCWRFLLASCYYCSCSTSKQSHKVNIILV